MAHDAYAVIPALLLATMAAAAAAASTPSRAAGGPPLGCTFPTSLNGNTLTARAIEDFQPTARISFVGTPLTIPAKRGWMLHAAIKSDDNAAKHAPEHVKYMSFVRDCSLWSPVFGVV